MNESTFCELTEVIVDKAKEAIEKMERLGSLADEVNGKLQV